MTQTFVEKLEAPFIALFVRIKEEVNAALPKVEQIAVDVEQGAIASLEAVFEAGYPFARDAILAEAPKLLSGQEKFGNAVANVAQKLQAELGPIVIADVQALVQIVYRGLKNIIGVKS